MTPEEALKKYYGYDSFRPGQREIIDSLMSHRDVLAIMPTGAGKSLCYQLPAVLMPGLTIVFSPLISLIQDQVRAMNEIGVPADFVASTVTPKKSEKIYEKAIAGELKLLYVAPERLKNDRFMEFAEKAEISMVTVDEAHCVSQWGQNFRPDYMDIVNFIRERSERPVVGAFTATATTEVKDDILCILGLEDPFVLVTGFDRPNLTFRVETGDRNEFIRQYVAEHSDESGIIYCATKKAVDAVCDLLVSAGVNAVKYYSTVPAAEKHKNQEDFVYDRASVMVATNAFGMGIDKSNVRFVIHYNMPKCIEDYYQEAGRAGRDGLPSECTLLYTNDAVAVNRNLIDYSFKDSKIEDEEIKTVIHERDYKRLFRMNDYCRGSECLRNNILKYFGEKPTEPCGRCSVCLAPKVEEDATAEARAVLRCVTESGEHYGVNKIISIALGSKTAEMKEINAELLACYGTLKGTDKDWLKKLIYQMTAEGVLVRTDDEYPVLTRGPEAEKLEAEGGSFMSKTARKVLPEKVKSAPAPAKRSYFDDLTGAGRALFDELRDLRMTIAKAENMPPYIVFADTSLLDMCRKLPKNKAEMLNVKGVGENKYEKYGETFSEAIAAFVAAHPDTVISTYVESEEPAEAVKEKPAVSDKYAEAVHDREMAHKRIMRMLDGLDDRSDAVVSLLKKLEQLRIDAAKEAQCAYDDILFSRTLQDIARKQPRTMAELKFVAGLNEERCEKYGARIIELVNQELPQVSAPAAESEGSESISGEDALSAETSAQSASEETRDCSGLTIAVTGKVAIFKDRNAIEDYIRSKGGKVTGVVSARTDLLVNNDNLSDSKKNRNAHALNVPIITEAEFVARYGGPDNT